LKTSSVIRKTWSYSSKIKRSQKKARHCAMTALTVNDKKFVKENQNI